jgi:hypothetical protein
MLPVSVDCPFLNVPSLFSSMYNIISLFVGERGYDKNHGITSKHMFRSLIQITIFIGHDTTVVRASAKNISSGSSYVSSA